MGLYIQLIPRGHPNGISLKSGICIMNNDGEFNYMASVQFILEPAISAASKPSQPCCSTISEVQGLRMRHPPVALLNAVRQEVSVGEHPVTTRRPLLRPTDEGPAWMAHSDCVRLVRAQMLDGAIKGNPRYSSGGNFYPPQTC